MTRRLTVTIFAAALAAAANDITRLRQDLSLIPRGAVVQVQTLDKRTLRGRLGAIGNDGFELEYVKGGQLVTETVPLAAVRSVRQFDLQQRNHAKRRVVSLIAFVGSFVILIAALAATGNLGA